MIFLDVGYTKEAERFDKIYAELESQYPIFQSIKKNEPALYEKLSIMIDDGIYKRHNTATILYDTSLVIKDYAQKKIPFVSDDVLLEHTNVNVQIAKDLYAKDPKECVKLIRHTPSENLLNLIQTNTLERDIQSLNAIILSKQQSDLKIASEEEKLALINPIMMKHANAMHIDSKDIVSYIDGKQEPDKSCQFFIKIMEDILSLPPEQSALFLRSGMKAANKM